MKNLIKKISKIDPVEFILISLLVGILIFFVYCMTISFQRFKKLAENDHGRKPAVVSMTKINQ
jgi:hypothetical protein